MKGVLPAGGNSDEEGGGGSFQSICYMFLFSFLAWFLNYHTYILVYCGALYTVLILFWIYTRYILLHIIVIIWRSIQTMNTYRILDYSTDNITICKPFPLFALACTCILNYDENSLSTWYVVMWDVCICFAFYIDN